MRDKSCASIITPNDLLPAAMIHRDDQSPIFHVGLTRSALIFASLGRKQSLACDKFCEYTLGDVFGSPEALLKDFGTS